jgi:FixJ family two-component response regulator
VVDDDPSVGEALSSLIRSAGYECAVFRSAEAFLASGRIGDMDCMVLDVRMPGMNGLELVLELRSWKCATPFICVTAQNDERTRAAALAGGAVAYLGKPVQNQALLSAIRIALDGAG